MLKILLNVMFNYAGVLNKFIFTDRVSGKGSPSVRPFVLTLSFELTGL